MKGISPIVAMVLLIALAVIAAMGVFFWTGAYTSKPAVQSYSAYFSAEGCDISSVTLRNTGTTIADQLGVPFYSNNGTQVGYIDIKNFTAGSAVNFPIIVSNPNISSGTYYILGNNVPQTIFSCTKASKASLYINGVDGYVNVTDSQTMNITNNQVTFMYWAKTISTGAHLQVFHKGNSTVSIDRQFGAAFTPGDTTTYFTLRTSNGIVDANRGPIPADVWNHIALVYNSTDMIWYVNGVNVSSASQTGNIATKIAPMMIGAFGSAGSTQYKGWIDEFRVYNRSLNATEVNNSYLGSPPADATNLVLYYSFDWTSLDGSAYGNNGTFYNGAYFSKSQS